MLTAKAYNGRVITEWLSYELVLATQGDLRENELIRWTCITVILDLISFLIAQCAYYNFCFLSLLSNCKQKQNSFYLRNALARFFGIAERSGRYLPPGSQLGIVC